SFRLLAYGRTDFTGERIGWGPDVRPSSNAPGIHRARMRFQQDISFIPKGTLRRVRVSSRHSLEVTGSQIGESMEREMNRVELSLEEPVTLTLVGTALVSGEGNTVESSTEVRNRTVDGWTATLGIRWTPSRIMESGGDIHVGRDRVLSSYQDFSSRLTGAGIHALWFPHRGGRIQAAVDYFRVTAGTPGEVSLPPESSRGLPLGNTYRASVTGILVLGPSLSANVHMSYTLDSIHDELLSITGEIRATF
ncbi:MAG: hypothetical protein ACE5HZ_09440, partial [Fidelibacterota bacterium]